MARSSSQVLNRTSQKEKKNSDASEEEKRRIIQYKTSMKSATNYYK